MLCDLIGRTGTWVAPLEVFERGLRRGLFVGLLAGLIMAAAGRPVFGQVVINEFLASNAFTNVDDDGKAEDWAELYNPGTTEVRLAGWWFTDDPALPNRWVFPDVSIPAKGYLLVWLSGNDRFAPPPEVIRNGTGLLAFDPIFIEDEAQWRYIVANPALAGPPAGWNQRGFDAGAFATGNAGFGYGDGDDFTELAVDTPAVFIRKEFQVANPAELGNLVLRVDYDDGFVAYLNGTRVASSNAPASGPDFTSVATAKHEAGTAELYDLTRHIGRLVSGTNVLALVGLNDIPSSDMSLAPELGVVPLVLHTNFRLQRFGEELLLSDPDGNPVDHIVNPIQTEDRSYGRAPDGGDDWFYFLTPTPNAANTTKTFDQPISDKVIVSPPPGHQAQNRADVTMSLGGALPEATIRYTRDGREPTAASPTYTGPISITGNTVFRIAGFISGERFTRIRSASYFFRQNFVLPTMSISMDPADYAFVHNTSGARGRGSEREAFMEFYEPTGELGFATGFGLRLHGGAGRGGGFDIKKAYKTYFRGSYGDKKLNYRIIPETEVDVFDKLVLRSGFNDSYRTSGRSNYLRDELIRDLHADMGALAASGSWCMLFVNMKFRGLYNIVERMDEEFASSYFEDEDWDVIKTGNDVLVGTRDEWNRLRNFVRDNDLRQDALYEQAIELLDLGNFTSYMIVNIWAQNHDWPHNNWYAARPRRPDGKWIFLSWDAEFGIGLNPNGYGANTFRFVFDRGGYLREILEGLLANQRYRAFFLGEFERHLAGALSVGNVLNRIRLLRDHVVGDIPEEVAQFNRTLSHWRGNVAEMETFARNRGPIILNFVKNSQRFDFAGLTVPGITRVSPDRIENVAGAEVRIFGTNLSADTKVFFNDVPASAIRFTGGRLIVGVPEDLGFHGSVRVKLENSNGLSSERDGLLEILLPFPKPTKLFPAEGSALGGEQVVIQGTGFSENSQVLFGGVAAMEVRFLQLPATPDAQTLYATTPPGRGIVEVLVENTEPERVGAETLLTFEYIGPWFIRGDANLDGLVEIGDAVTILLHSFVQAVGGCEEAMDVDQSGSLDQTDAIRVLSFLFRDGENPAEPFPLCDADRDGDALGCQEGLDDCFE